MQVFHFFGWLWIMNFIIALGQCVLAGAFAQWYFTFQKEVSASKALLERWRDGGEEGEGRERARGGGRGRVRCSVEGGGKFYDHFAISSGCSPVAISVAALVSL